jgi:hypothetical protein
LDELRVALGETVPITVRGTLPTNDFLTGQTGDILGIEPFDARNKVSSLIRQTWDTAMRDRGLLKYEMANDRLAWWFPNDLPPDGQLRYNDPNGKPRRRAVQGTRGKKTLPDGSEVPRYYWHLGFTGQVYVGDPALGEGCHIILKPRLIITEDRVTPLENKTRLNSIRRGLTKMWFNNKWRGLVQGFCGWLSGGQSETVLQAGEGTRVLLHVTPQDFSILQGIASDPIAATNGEEEEERFEAEQEALRLSDPAFAEREDDDDDEEEAA